MEELLEEIFKEFDRWSRVWVAILVVVSVHLGVRDRGSPEFWCWYAMISCVTLALISLTAISIKDQYFDGSKKKSRIQKLIMFFSGPVLFLVIFLAFFTSMNEISQAIPFSMLEFTLLFSVSLYNLYCFILTHYLSTLPLTPN